ncbi:MAG TPA: transporter substrate-binding domain-containing protein, partial [Candidatus Limisoma gallistercoris]|nr:transporter substrate-binding domain-containing protein [Candidatus Limisoma gallistercoris]
MASHNLPDTIVVGTLYSPTSYFLYKGDVMGYHYDLITKFAKDKHIAVEFKIMRSLPALLENLDSANIDIVAYNIPITAEYNQRIEHCGLCNITNQVLVQPTENGKKQITDVTQLKGKDVYVEKGSKYEAR